MKSVLPSQTKASSSRRLVANASSKPSNCVRKARSTPRTIPIDTLSLPLFVLRLNSLSVDSKSLLSAQIHDFNIPFRFPLSSRFLRLRDPPIPRPSSVHPGAPPSSHAPPPSRAPRAPALPPIPTSSMRSSSARESPVSLQLKSSPRTTAAPSRASW